MDVIKFPEKENDVKQTLQNMMERAEHFDAVIVIALNKDSTCFMETSTSNALEKMYLIKFAESWAVNWYKRVAQYE